MLKRSLPGILMSFLFVSGIIAQSNAGNSPGSAVPAQGKQARKSSSPDNDMKGPCPSGTPKERFYVDIGGNISDTGRTFEGPLCVEVFFNPVQVYVGLQSSTSVVAGPDRKSVV